MVESVYTHSSKECDFGHAGSTPAARTYDIMVYMDSKFGKEYHRAYYYKRRQEIIDYLGGKCVICGSQENLQFDHIDPSQKLFDIKSKLSLRTSKEEIDKCQLLCRPCHLDKTGEENTGFTHGTIYGWMKKKCGCDSCQRAKRSWHDARNLARRSIPTSGTLDTTPSMC